MTQAELYQALKSIGYPVAYGSFSSPVTPPFITYQFAYNSDLIADNVNYVPIENFQVELYTAKKDLVAEQKVQDKLKELGLPYQKFETYLDTENLYQILYEIQLLGG
ncbi:putative tail-component [Geobacillus phage vB_GthS_PK3.6]|nr:putative tail-component [Geobacillus phage vB_GthS_PK3.6]UYL94112.1 putative tail component [Geobacillus phage vB_GthS_PK5.1]